MRRKIFTLLTLLLCAVSGAWADEVTFTYGNSDPVASVASTGITSSSTSSSKSGSNGHTLKNNEAITITAGTSGKTITAVSVTYNRYNTKTVFAIDNSGSTTTAWSVTSSTGTWAGSATTITITGNNDSNSDRITSIAVTYTSGGGGGETPVTLEFATASGSLDISSASPALPAVTSAPDVSAITSNITYSSSNTAVATVNASTGALTLVGIGTTTITARFAGDATYQEASDTYTLTVTDATKLGYAEVMNPTAKTLDARWLFGMSHAAVTLKYADYYGKPQGSIEDNSTSATVYLNGTAAANQYTNARSWKKMQNGYTVEGKDQWVGYDIAVDENYVLNLTHLDARILVADDTYKWYVEILDKNGTQVYKSAEQTTTKASTANFSTDINVTNLTGDVRVKLWVTQGGSTKYFSIEKLILTGATAEDTRPERTITFAAGEGSGTAPADITIREGETFFFPTAPLLYKTGSTLTAWNDGTSNHNVGTSVAVSGNMDLTAQFTANTVALGDEETNVEWTFKTANGAPTLLLQTSGVETAVYSKRTTIGETPFDALMTIDASSGKFDNTVNAAYAQVNANTKFTIPAVKGMVVTLSCNQTPGAVTDATFAGDNATSYDGTAKTLTYTYTGTDATIDIIVSNGNLYPDGISVAYPIGKYTMPTIVKGDFNFEHKGYKVTITKTEGDNLMVSTDGSAYTAQTSPYVTYATETTTFYAKATGSEKDDSKVASLEVANTYNLAKPYVAWVYENGYGVASYAFNTDPMVSALQNIYNVVEVKLAQSTDPTTATDISNADLIVCTEAMAGNKTLSNKMEDYVGTTPMLGLKFFNYTSGRWDWGTPANPSSTILGFTPTSTKYKVLDGVTYENDGTIKLATQSYNSGSQKNVVQTVTWSSAPSGNVDMGSADSKVAMHCATKYFGLGLSSDCWQYYTANAITIVKNAAAMLIAGEDLDTEVENVTATIGTYGYTTFSSSYSLNLGGISGGTAYSVAASGITASEVTPIAASGTIAAGEGLILAGDPGATVTIPVAASGSAIEGNKMVGCPAGATIDSETTNYSSIYVMVNTTEAVFKNVNDWVAASKTVTIPAGKAYLQAAGVSLSRSLRLNFDSITSIDQIENGELNIENSQPVKRVVKGQLVIEKNGKKFNAAGAQLY